MRVLKVFGIIVVAVSGLLVLAVAAIKLVPGNQYKDLISSAVKSATGRELVIGNLDVDLGSSLKIAASDVSLSNADWGSRPQMFTGRLIEGEILLQPLLDGVLDLRLALEAPDLLLEKDAEGRGNWQMGAGRPEAVTAASDTDDADEGPRLRPLLREVRLDQVSLTYVDAQAGERQAAEFKTVLVRSRGDKLELKAEGRVGGQALALTGGVDGSAISDATAPVDFSLTGKLGDIELEARGTLDGISANAQADVLLEARSASLATLSVFTGRDLPDQGPLHASLRLKGGEGNYRAKDIKLELGAALLRATVDGAVDDLAGMRGIDLVVSARTDRLAEIAKEFGLELPVEPPPFLDVEGRLQGSLEALALADYRVAVRDEGVQATIKGQVANLIALNGIQAELALKTRSLAALSGYAATELPDSGAVELNGKLSSPKGLEAPSEVSAVLSADGVSAQADGSVGNLLAATGISLAVNLESESLRQVARLVGRDVARQEPLRVSTDLQLGKTDYRADKLHLALGDNEITGNLAYTPPVETGGRAKLQGRLDLGKLDLAALAGGDAAKPAGEPKHAEENTPQRGAVPDGVTDPEVAAPTPAAAGERSKAKPEKVFPSDPLPLEALRELDMDLDITADELGTVRLLLEGLSAKLTLSNGVLKLEPVNASVGKGTFKARSVLDASRSPAILKVGIDLADGTSRRFGGRYDVDVDLEGAGDSVAQLMAGLDGQVILDMRDMQLDKSFMTRFGQGLLDTINPFDKKAEKTKLVCAIVRFDIEDGIADAEDKIVAQLTNVTWFGGGTIDLKTEALNLGAQSKPRTGLGIDTTAGLAGLVYIGGTLADPRIVPDPKGMAKTYGEGYLAIATGGLYLLAKGLWDRTQANSDVCAEILAKRKEVKQRPVRAGTSPDQAVTPGDGVQVTAPAPGAGAKPVKKPEPQKDPFKALEIAD